FSSVVMIGIPRPPRSPPFPYTTLFRSRLPRTSCARTDREWTGEGGRCDCLHSPQWRTRTRGGNDAFYLLWIGAGRKKRRYRRALDRKSTRLNSSHVSISYAVFCLKKKT